MAYFFVVNYDVTNSELHDRYVQLVRPTLGLYGGRPLIADYAPKDIEGKSREILVVLEFASREAALTWYNSPEYQAIIRMRTDASTNGWFREAPEFVMPASI